MRPNPTPEGETMEAMSNQAGRSDEQTELPVCAHCSRSITSAGQRCSNDALCKPIDDADAASRLPKEESVPDDCLDTTDDGKVIIAAPPAKEPAPQTFEHPRADCEGCGDPNCPCNLIDADGFLEWWRDNNQSFEASDSFTHPIDYAAAAWNAAKASSQITLHPVKNASGMEVCRHCLKSNGEHSMEDKCLDNAGNRLGTDWAPLMAPSSSPAVPEEEESTVPRSIAHTLWNEGGRLRTELAASLGMHPENWHKEGLQQRIAEWDKAAERYFDYALLGAPSSPAVTGGESASEFYRKHYKKVCNSFTDFMEFAETYATAQPLIKDVRGEE